MGYWGFVRKAYVESSKRGLLRFLLFAAEIGGVLALFGYSMVLVNLLEMPPWIPAIMFLLASTSMVLIGLHGAYVLWKDAVQRVVSPAVAPEILVAPLVAERVGAAVQVERSNNISFGEVHIEGSTRPAMSFKDISGEVSVDSLLVKGPTVGGDGS